MPSKQINSGNPTRAETDGPEPETAPEQGGNGAGVETEWNGMEWQLSWSGKGTEREEDGTGMRTGRELNKKQIGTRRDVDGTGTKPERTGLKRE